MSAIRQALSLHHLVKQRIMQSADDLGQPGVDPFCGVGRINVARALGL